MSTPAQNRVVRPHIVVCLLLLAALLCVSVVAASHMHLKQDVHEGQCALCMSCAQMVAVCTAIVVAFLLAFLKQEQVFLREQEPLATWISPALRVRPPPFV